MEQPAHSEHSGHAVASLIMLLPGWFSDLPFYMSSQGQHSFSGLVNHPNGTITMVHSKLSEVLVE